MLSEPDTTPSTTAPKRAHLIIVIGAWSIALALTVAWASTALTRGLGGGVEPAVRNFALTALIAAIMASIWWSIHLLARRVIAEIRAARADWDTGYEHGHGDGMMRILDALAPILAQIPAGERILEQLASVHQLGRNRKGS